MPKYICNRRLEHDQEVFEPNQEIALDEQAARALLEIGAIEPSLAPKKPGKDSE